MLKRGRFFGIKYQDFFSLEFGDFSSELLVRSSERKTTYSFPVKSC